MNARIFFLWIALAVAGSASCSQKDGVPPDAVQVSYAQTYCLDRWGQANDPQQLVTVAQAYLTQQGVTLYRAQATTVSPPSPCLSCGCKTGVVLEGLVSGADLPRVTALGFTH